MAFLEMKHITKRFGSVVANEDVTLSVEKGEIHALLGENGAGKSTLMNILYGLYQPNEGEVFLRGLPVSIKNPKEAIDQGVGMVHQHFMLVPALSVIENVILGMKNGAVLNLPKAADAVQKLAAKYKLSIDPYAKVWQLSVGQQQRLEIIKALYRRADLLILDEPTAVLTPQEVEELFGMIRQLTEEGHTVIFITHKLDEVMEICDRCTVLRLGRLETTVRIQDIHDKQELASLMVGRDVQLTTDKKAAQFGQPVLEVSELDAMNDKHLPALDKVSFSIREGEILGVAGVDGNGQSELAECLTGLRTISGGTVHIEGQDVTGLAVRKILEHSVSHIPEDRHKRGMVAGMSVKENLSMVDYYKEPYNHHGFLNRKYIEAHSEALCKEYNVKTPSVDEMAEKLSGGNQQKFVVGRELNRKPKLLVAMHPDRGLDIGASKYIQGRLVEARDCGAAVLLISTELDEVLELSDRVMVMYEGKVMGIFEEQEISREKIGMLMAGIHQDFSS